MLRPWCDWLIQHNLKFVIYIVFALIAPIAILCSVGSHINSSVRDLNHELQSIKGYKKHE